jgi:hypothetical protein
MLRPACYNHSTATRCSTRLNSGSPVKMARPFFFAVATAKQSAKEMGYSAFILNAFNLFFNPQVEKLPGTGVMH